MIAPSFICSKWLRSTTLMLPVAVTKRSPTRRGPVHRHHREAVHRRLERPDRVDLGDDHPGAHAAHPHRDALAAPAVAGDDDRLAGQQDVGGAQDAVDRALAGAVAVVEEVLGVGVVDGDHRELEQPFVERTVANNSGRCFFRRTDDVGRNDSPDDGD